MVSETAVVDGTTVDTECALSTFPLCCHAMLLALACGTASKRCFARYQYSAHGPSS